MFDGIIIISGWFGIYWILDKILKRKLKCKGENDEN